MVGAALDIESVPRNLLSRVPLLYIEFTLDHWRSMARLLCPERAHFFPVPCQNLTNHRIRAPLAAGRHFLTRAHCLELSMRQCL